MIPKVKVREQEEDIKMYPKVKVREQEEDEDDLLSVYDYEARPLPPLEAFESLSTHELSSSVRGCEDDSPPSIVRIPETYISNSSSPMVPLSKGESKSSNRKKAVEDTEPNIRASSIPRPRAVLSSPDNDGMIGSRNKAKTELLLGLKDHNLSQNRHTQCKVIPRRNTFETPITTRRESKEAADGKTGLKEKRGTVTTDPRHRAHPRKGKPNSVWI